MRSFEDKPADERVRRLFFALWPEDTVRDRLQEVAAELRQRCAARWVKREHFHITLCFLGALPEADRVRLGDLELEWPGVFDLCLEELQFLKRRQMIWLVPRTPPEALRHLVELLSVRLDACGIAHDARPFHAHLTLARKASGGFFGPKSVHTVQWSVESVALMESVLDRSGAHYRVVHSWPLQAMPAGGSVK